MKILIFFSVQSTKYIIKCNEAWFSANSSSIFCQLKFYNWKIYLLFTLDIWSLHHLHHPYFDDISLFVAIFQVLLNLLLVPIYLQCSAHPAPQTSQLNHQNHHHQWGDHQWWSQDLMTTPRTTLWLWLILETRWRYIVEFGWNR